MPDRRAMETIGAYMGQSESICGECSNNMQLVDMNVPTFSGETRGFVCMTRGCPRNRICGFPFKKHAFFSSGLIGITCNRCGLIPNNNC